VINGYIGYLNNTLPHSVDCMCSLSSVDSPKLSDPLCPTKACTGADLPLPLLSSVGKKHGYFESEYRRCQGMTSCKEGSSHLRKQTESNADRLWDMVTFSDKSTCCYAHNGPVLVHTSWGQRYNCQHI
jgi:hypothetical protein